jgi:hypothetical protein
MTSTPTNEPVSWRPTRPGRRRSKIYLVVGLLMLGITVAGFWPSYYGRLLAGTPIEPEFAYWVIDVHSTIFLGWLLLFLIQAVLVWSDRTDLHRRMGALGIGYALLTVIAGVVGGYLLVLHRVAGGMKLDQAAAFLFVPLSDIVMFAGFFGAAILYRDRPEVHKRLRALAMLTFAQVGTGRLLVHLWPSLLQPRWHFNTAWFVPVAGVLAHDLLTRRRVHPVYLVGGVLFLLRINRIPLCARRHGFQSVAPCCGPSLISVTHSTPYRRLTTA